MELLKEKILNHIRLNGPVLPIQISKITGHDLVFSGALLSELISEKKIKISNAKFGGSPVYYIAGQEEKLNVLYKGLPDKEKEAYDLLKNKRFILDKHAEPSIRVALRSIKDFALPSYIDTGNGPEIIWKWYLSKEEEINEFVNKLKQPIKPIQIIQKPIVQPIQQIKPEIKEKQIKLKKEIKPEELLNKLLNYFKNNGIEIIEKNQVRKNKEYDFIGKVPSKLGNLEYFIIYKDKKRISEADLTLAYNKGHSRKLPVLLLSTGELSKKTELYREKNLKGYLIFKKV